MISVPAPPPPTNAAHDIYTSGFIGRASVRACVSKCSRSDRCVSYRASFFFYFTVDLNLAQRFRNKSSLHTAAHHLPTTSTAARSPSVPVRTTIDGIIVGPNIVGRARRQKTAGRLAMRTNINSLRTRSARRVAAVRR